MLSRVPPREPIQPLKHQVQDIVQDIVPNGGDLRHIRYSVCTLVPVSTSSPLTRATVAGYSDLVVNGPSRDELSILRAQYVARGVRVLVGSRWRLNRFRERTIVLRTGAEPTLAVYVDEVPASFDTNNSSGEMQPEAVHELPIGTKCELIGATGTADRSSKRSVVTAIQLSTTGEFAFRLRIRFMTAADAKIWCSVVREALALARWSRDVQPVKEDKKFARGGKIRVVQHVCSSQRFVIKALATNNEEGDCHELQILRQLFRSWFAQDFGLVRGYRVVETTQETMLIMPQLPGITLLQFLRQRRRHNDRKLDDEDAWRLVTQLAALLRAVHQSGIVHCDLNLENVLVSEDISHVWLIDFGGAYNLLDGHNPQQMTGTPGYVAPERVQYPMIPPTPMADVFSLGVLLFQALTGQHPYFDTIQVKRPLQLSDALHLDLTRAEEILTEHTVSPDMRSLVGEMLVAEPQARVSLDKIVEAAAFCVKK